MSEPIVRSEALLVYDGNALDDLSALLEEMGVRPQRARLSGPTRFEGWAEPPRLFVISAKDALNTPWPEGALGQSVCRIAVTESTSEVLGALVSELGYDYLIRRPVHPEVLRMLFERALFSGAETRRNPRRPAAREVSLRVGWRSLPGTLIDISRGGARLLVRTDVEVLDSVAITLALGPEGDRKITLPGRVIRKRRSEQDGVVSMALRFLEEIEPEPLAEIAAHFASGALGPAPELPRPWNDQLRSWWNQSEPERPADAVAARNAAEVQADTRLPTPLRPRPLHRSEAATAPDGGPDRRELAPPRGAELEAPGVVAESAVARDRRQLRRGTFDSEVVQLDPETAAMRSVLVGRELSVAGMHVDPHPDMFVGDRLSLALHDALDGPLLLTASVARDDGLRGMSLEFEGLSEEASSRLERMVGALPAAPRGEPEAGSPSLDPLESAVPGVESLGQDGPEGLVLARRIAAQATADDFRG